MKIIASGFFFVKYLWYISTVIKEQHKWNTLFSSELSFTWRTLPPKWKTNKND